MSMSTDAAKPLTGRTVLIAIVAFFAVVIGVNMVMMKLAVDTLSGTDVDSAYRASLAYENEINAARDQDMRKWRIDARIERQSDGVAALRVEAHDSNGSPLVGLEFSGRLQRPADKRLDRPIILAAAGNGVYLGNISEVVPGQWDLVIEGELTGKRMFLSKSRIVLN